MASSGEARGSFSGRSAFSLRIAVARAETDQANNRTRWNWSLAVYNENRSTDTWSGGSGQFQAYVNGVLVVNGSASPFDFRDGAEFHVVQEGSTGWIQHNTDGNKTIPISASARSSTIFGNADASGAVSADRIVHSAPTGLRPTRGSDVNHRLDWTRNSTYSSVIVQRATNTGGWQQIANPSGNVSSYTDKSTSGNRRYQYRVAGRAGNAQTGWSNTVQVFTTPARPTGVSAKRSGDNIVVNASGRPPYVDSYDVRDGSAVIASEVSLPYTHVGPDPSVAHTYTVQARKAWNNTGGSDLLSGYSANSNTVQLESAPNAPVSLAPNGKVLASDGPVRFTWQHNPVDASDQSAYELRYRELGGGWTVLSGTTVEFREEALPVAGYEWQVRTKGKHPDFSAWSSTATVDVVDRPGVAITQPVDEWDSSTLTVEWTWMQNQDRPQSAWQVRLRDVDDAVVATRDGSGDATSSTVDYSLTEGTWTVEVRAATGDIWSEWAQEVFTVAFDPPAVPTITGWWDEETGAVYLDVAPGDDAGAPVTERLWVERSLDGEAWELVTEVSAATQVTDWESWSYGDVIYRVTAGTAEGATSEAQTVVSIRSDAVWLSGGVGFAVNARLPYDPDIQFTVSRQRALKLYAGRSLPVSLTGEGVSRVVSVKGRTVDGEALTSSFGRLVNIGQVESDRFLYRDPDGNRIYGSIGDIQLPREMSIGRPSEEGYWSDREWLSVWSYSFTLTETGVR